MRRLALLSFVFVGAGCWPVEDGPTADTAAAAVGGGAGSEPAECVPMVEQPAFERSGKVTGRVTSPSGTIPVRSAIAAADADGESAWMLTNCGDGAFTLELPAGAHTISVTKGRWSATRVVDVVEGQTLDLGDIALEGGEVAIAVVTGEYDDIGALIADAGIPFDVVGRPSDLLDDAELLAGYDVVFLSCGTLAGRGLEPYTDAQGQALRAWLEAGGTLYASDWEHEAVELAVPEALDFGGEPRLGEIALIDATVLDRDVQTILGKDSASIRFNLAQWAVIAGTDQAFPVVSGLTPHDGEEHPLAALMPVELGKVIYTSFHNEQQITEDMEIILYEMILSL